jgi:hypothetical protein
MMTLTKCGAALLQTTASSARAAPSLRTRGSLLRASRASRWAEPAVVWQLAHVAAFRWGLNRTELLALLLAWQGCPTNTSSSRGLQYYYGSLSKRFSPRGMGEVSSGHACCWF